MKRIEVVKSVKLLKTLKKFPIFKSWKNFVLIGSLIGGFIWLSYFRYGVTVDTKSSTLDIIFDVRDLSSECELLKKGMSLNQVDNAVLSRNKRLVTRVKDIVYVNYWIAESVVDHLPKSDYCFAEFDDEEKLLAFGMK